MIMEKIYFAPFGEIRRVLETVPDKFSRLKILADILRINALYMIRRAGSGHPGTSFSAMDIMAWLHFEAMCYGDIFFSSKGHDVPALYSILLAQAKLPFEKIHELRKLGGLPGHPDVRTPGIATNTGSLGMGISKAHGMALAGGNTGRIYVLSGDGELQEGQIWESLRSAAQRKLSAITLIVDHNKIQSDLNVKDTGDLGDVENKFSAFGWAILRCDGHNFEALSKTLELAKKVKDRPQAIIADTVKGKGVSFMERLGEDGLYKFHSGAPSIEQYDAALIEILQRVNFALKSSGEEELKLESREIEIKTPPEKILRLNFAYGDELVRIARDRRDIVALDADLVLDTGLLPFKKEFPERYLECGIAEQDMVSIAGGLALRGALPIAHSFACFLSTRPNEQIYNNATERTKIIYVASLAGLLPATPGHSHQSVRDISALGSIPGLVMFEPSCEEEVRLAIRWAVYENKESTYIRICNVPAEISYSLPKNYSLKAGRGVFLKKGKDIAIVAYGPVMLEQAMQAAEMFKTDGRSVAVINFPWLNRVDKIWLRRNLARFQMVVTLDDHYLKFGQGQMIISALARCSEMRAEILNFGVEEIPACGQNREVLRYHGLDAESVYKKIKKALL